MTRHSCGTFFSVKKRVGGVLGEPGAPAAPRNEAALVRVLLLEEVVSGSSPRHVGGKTAEFFMISTVSCSWSVMWWCRSFDATTAAPAPACPSNKAQYWKVIPSASWKETSAKISRQALGYKSPSKKVEDQGFSTRELWNLTQRLLGVPWEISNLCPSDG